MRTADLFAPLAGETADGGAIRRSGADIASIPTRTPEPEPQRPGRLVNILGCQCFGDCSLSHGFRKCPRLRVPSTLLCNECACTAGSDSSSSRSSRCRCERYQSHYCFSHLYLSLPRELQVLRRLSQEGLLQQMIPSDLEQFLASRNEFGDDLVLQLIAAWLQEPAAVRALVNFKPKRTNYSAKELLCC